MKNAKNPAYKLVHNPAKLPGMIYGNDLDQWRLVRLMPNGRYLTIDCARTQAEAMDLFKDIVRD